MNQREEDDVKFAFAFIGILVAIVLFFVASCANGQGNCYYDQYGQRICPQQQQQQQPVIDWTQGGQRQGVTPTAMDILVTARDRDGGNSIGSGTAVHRMESGETLIVTNAHVIRDRASDNSITLRNGRGETAPAVVLEVDTPNDLAVLQVRSRWDYVNLGEPIQPGDAVHVRGWAYGRTFTKSPGQVLGRYEAHQGAESGYFLSSRVAEGMSGGGVFKDGLMVGVIWGGTADGSVNGTMINVGPLRAIVNRVLQRVGGRQNASQVARYQQPPSPQAPAPQNQSPLQPLPGTQPGCDCPEQFAAINARLDSLEAGQQKSLDVSASLVAITEKHTAALASIDERIDVRVATAISKFPPQPESAKVTSQLDDLASRLEQLEQRKIQLEIYDNGKLVGTSEGRSVVGFDVQSVFQEKKDVSK